MKVVIAYDTRYGATADTSHKIGEVLQKRGIDVKVLDSGRMKSISPTTMQW